MACCIPVSHIPVHFESLHVASILISMPHLSGRLTEFMAQYSVCHRLLLQPGGSNSVPASHFDCRIIERCSPSQICVKSRSNQCSGCIMQAPAKASAAVGVKVEPGKGCLYVKVHCADRRGLLADIIAALKSMPLEVCPNTLLVFPALRYHAGGCSPWRIMTNTR